jgi:hypothetical protein
VGIVRCLDHTPIFLELGCPDGKPSMPFKYNSSWVDLEEFQNLITGNWLPYQDTINESTYSQFVASMHKLKKKVASWARERKKVKTLALRTVEEDLENLYAKMQGGNVSAIDLELCLSMEARRFNILLEQEKAWRLKSWALWLETIFQNSKFFQKFANFRKIFNTIWELKDSQGNKKRGFSDLAALGSNTLRVCSWRSNRKRLVIC